MGGGPAAGRHVGRRWTWPPGWAGREVRWAAPDRLWVVEGGVCGRQIGLQGPMRAGCRWGGGPAAPCCAPQMRMRGPIGGPCPPPRLSVPLPPGARDRPPALLRHLPQEFKHYEGNCPRSGAEGLKRWPPAHRSRRAGARAPRGGWRAPRAPIDRRRANCRLPRPAGRPVRQPDRRQVLGGAGGGLGRPEAISGRGANCTPAGAWGPAGGFCGLGGPRSAAGAPPRPAAAAGPAHALLPTTCRRWCATSTAWTPPAR